MDSSELNYEARCLSAFILGNKLLPALLSFLLLSIAEGG